MHLFGTLSRDQVLATAAALEDDLRHPIAVAFQRASVSADGSTTNSRASNRQVIASTSVRGTVNGTHFILGQPDYIIAQTAQNPAVTKLIADETRTVVLLAQACSIKVAIVLEAHLRPGALNLASWLTDEDIATSILSGDRSPAVAAEIGVSQWHGELRPADKLAIVRGYQQHGEVVAMTGDGINDTPVLAGSDVSVALADGPLTTRREAGLILLNAQLHGLCTAIQVARRTRHIIRGNIAWAVGLQRPGAAIRGAGLSAALARRHRYVLKLTSSSGQCHPLTLAKCGGTYITASAQPTTYRCLGIAAQRPAHAPMDIIFILLSITMLVVAAMALVFIWAVNSGQFDDLEGPAVRMLSDDDEPPSPEDPSP